MNMPAWRCRRLWTAAVILSVILLGGCHSSARRPKGELLAVSFQPDQPLRYQFVSARQVTIDLKGGPDDKKDSKSTKESLEMVLRIDPVEVDPFGLTTLQWTVESVKADRSSFTGKSSPPDAVRQAEGKSYTIQVAPTGKAEQTESFNQLIRQIGDNSFIPGGNSKQRIKNPDMIFDWIFFHKNLWDAPASIEKPLAGLNVGDEWKSRQFMPWPVPIRNIPTRTTTYRLREITGQEPDRKAVIEAVYALSGERYTDIPLPYEGSYQIRGSLFSVLINYQHQSLEGSGAQVYNLDSGILLSDHQEYTLVTSAAFILPLGDTVPYVTVSQTIDIRLLDDSVERAPGAAQ